MTILTTGKEEERDISCRIESCRRCISLAEGSKGMN